MSPHIQHHDPPEFMPQLPEIGPREAAPRLFLSSLPTALQTRGLVVRLEAVETTEAEPPRASPHALAVDDHIGAEMPAPDALGIEERHFV